jgi:hypothetical protein
MNDVSLIYNNAPGFNFDEFEHLKKQLLKNEKYSRFLIEIVMEMIDIDVLTRPLPSTVLEWIKPYAKEIVHFTKFERRITN